MISYHIFNSRKIPLSSSHKLSNKEKKIFCAIIYQCIKIPVGPNIKEIELGQCGAPVKPDKWHMFNHPKTKLPFIATTYSVHSITHNYADFPPFVEFYHLHYPVENIFYHPSHTPANNSEAASVWSLSNLMCLFSDSGHVKLHPSLFLLLLVLSRLYPSPMDGSSSPLGLAPFLPFIMR